MNGVVVMPYDLLFQVFTGVDLRLYFLFSVCFFFHVHVFISYKMESTLAMNTLNCHFIRSL